jgi:hypothetical protein
MDVILLVWVPDSTGIFQGRRDTYAFSLIDLLEMYFMFLLRKLMVLLALEQMVLICLPHLRSDEMVHPRYLHPSIGDGSKKGFTICY